MIDRTKEGMTELGKQKSMLKAKYCSTADEVSLWKLCSDFAKVISCMVTIFGNVV